MATEGRRERAGKESEEREGEKGDDCDHETKKEGSVLIC